MRKDHNLEKRKYVIGCFIIIIAVLYIFKLYSIQIDDDKYKNSAENNALLRKTVYPSRGLIYDRNGKLVVFNQPAYDVMMIPREVTELDTVDFCNTINITKEQFDKRIVDMKNSPGYSTYTPQTFITQLSAEDYGRLQEKLYRFPGFFIQKRVLRQYNYSIAANVLGNIREVNQRDIDNDPYYRPGDYCGDLGVERSYDKYLRGVKGEEILFRDARGRIQGKYKDGAEDRFAESGKNLTLSLDIDLQEYCEQLLQNKVGAIVAIEPATGEVLALATGPCYDPSLLVGRQRGENYAKLVETEFNPLLDRTIQGQYPPGSTFKPGQALILLQEGIITTSTAYSCYHGYTNGVHVGCHSHAAPIAVVPALGTSCNAFFCWGLHNMLDKRISKYHSTANAFETWKNHLVSMGYGYTLGIDLPHESRGFIPNAEFFSKIYGPKGWSANTVISISIGQGEILATPIQIANVCATIANRGWFITPHVVKGIQDNELDSAYTVPKYTTVDEKHYNTVVEGMRRAVTGGTCRRANIPGIEVCGKTGTAQNRGKDHSAFMGFAPMNDPKIAVAVYIEEGGFGAVYGVPIGRLVMEKYLNDSISPESKAMEQQMLNANTMVTVRKTEEALARERERKKKERERKEKEQQEKEQKAKEAEANVKK